MATGPEHYIEAERLLATAAVAQSQRGYGESEDPGALREAAAVHATLALAAATAMGHWNGAEMPMPQEDRLAWADAASGRLRKGMRT